LLTQFCSKTASECQVIEFKNTAIVVDRIRKIRMNDINKKGKEMYDL
jgi:hypothetical protein